MKSSHSYYFIFLLTVVSIFSCRNKEEEETACLPSDPTPYTVVIPPFFPPMDIPVDNPMTVEGIELGRFLFWDVQLSGDNSISCGACHLPEAAFSDNSQFSVGVNGAVGERQSMALVNIGWARDYFWDSRAATLEEQIHDPVVNPIEMAETWEDVVSKIEADPIYPPKFLAAFGSTEVTELRMRKAIAQFLRPLISADSNFDKWRRGEYILTESEFRGYELFLKEGGDPEVVVGGEFGADCFHCHVEAGMQFSDYLPHNNGLDAVFTDLGVGGVTGDPLQMGKFKTPTLRNIELTAPYMHDGRFSTLEQVVEHYNSGGQPSETIDPFMKYTSGGLTLSPQSKADIINFLKTLTDTSFVNNPAFHNPHE
jgi:cytochrome c peroxidase